MFENNKTIKELIEEKKPLEIKIKYHNSIQNLPHIEKIEKGDWIDLRSSKEYVLYMTDFEMIDLGVSMQLPVGYEAIIAPRSSLYKRHGLIVVNSIGIIDNSYSGTNDVWKLPVLCLKAQTTIQRGERIAQFRIVKSQPPIYFKEVEELGEERGGFGSTGIM